MNDREYQVDVLDVPGERFYDIEMYGRDYDEWCDALDEIWQDEPHSAMADYRELFAHDKLPDAPSCVAAYRKLLSGLIADYRTCITPSTFRLNRNGNFVKGRTAEQILESAQNNYCGYSFDQQFAPIFGNAREKLKGVVATMRGHYGAYRNDVVTPLFSDLQLCDRLVILIDVPHLLAAGDGALEDQNHLTERVLKALVPEPGFWRTAARWLGDSGRYTASLFSMACRARQDRRVAFVATKSDLVAQSDAKNGRLSELLSKLVRPKRSFLWGITPQEIVLSTIKSTARTDTPDDDNFGHLNGSLMFDYESEPPTYRSPGDPKVDYPVSRLPNEWPQKWVPGKYSFPPVYPQIPRHKLVCPRQENLNELLQFIIQ